MTGTVCWPASGNRTVADLCAGMHASVDRLSPARLRQKLRRRLNALMCGEAPTGDETVDDTTSGSGTVPPTAGGSAHPLSTQIERQALMYEQRGIRPTRHWIAAVDERM